MKTMIVIPTYNEKENISRLITEILWLRDNLNVLVVDDNSPDGTGQIVDEIAQANPRVHILHRYCHKGRDTAGIDGFRHTMAQGADFIMEMDADFSHPPRSIPDFLRIAHDWHVVIASRYVKGGGSTGSPWPQRLQSRLANLAVKLILGLEFHDSTGGFKGYHRHVLERLPFDDFLSQGWSIGAETLFHIARQGFSCKEIPYTFVSRQRGMSKAHPLESFQYLAALLQICRRWR